MKRKECSEFGSSGPGAKAAAGWPKSLRRSTDGDLLRRLLQPLGATAAMSVREWDGFEAGGLARLSDRQAFRRLPLPEVERRHLAVALEIGRRVYGAGGPSLASPADVFAWSLELRMARRERFVALYLDARHRVRRRRLISVGTLTASLVHPREVLAPAVRHRAAAIVAVHNHPSGDPEPSAEDCTLTERLRDAALLLGIDLLDHVIVAREGYVSLRERGVLL